MKSEADVLAHFNTREEALLWAIENAEEGSIVVHKNSGEIDYTITAIELQRLATCKDFLHVHKRGDI